MPAATADGPTQRKVADPLLYLFVLPAALTLLGGLNDLVDFSDLFRRFLAVWRAATHWAWDQLFGWLQIAWFKPSPLQMDGLTLAVMFLGAAASPFLSRVLRASRDPGVSRFATENERWIFFAALLAILIVFLLPNLQALAQTMQSNTIVFGWRPPLPAALAMSLALPVMMLVVLLVLDRATLARGSPQAQVAQTGLSAGFVIGLATFFVAPNPIKPVAAEGVLGWLGAYMASYWAAITALSTWTNAGIQIALAAIFAIGFSAMYARNPRMVIRTLAVGVGLYLTDRLYDLLGPALPGVMRLLETWEASVPKS